MSASVSNRSNKTLQKISWQENFLYFKNLIFQIQSFGHFECKGNVTNDLESIRKLFAWARCNKIHNKNNIKTLYWILCFDVQSDLFISSNLFSRIDIKIEANERSHAYIFKRSSQIGNEKKDANSNFVKIIDLL